MVDSGATALFISQKYVKEKRIRTFPLSIPIKVYNIDGTLNHAGSITHFARLSLTIEDNMQWLDFYITDIGEEDVILGLPWLRKSNVRIDWAEGRIEIPTVAPITLPLLTPLPEPNSTTSPTPDTPLSKPV